MRRDRHNRRGHNRREFIRSTATGAAAAGMAAYFFTSPSRAQESKNDRLVAGSIGLGGMGHGDARSIARFADIVAVCDVDRTHAEHAAADEHIGKGKAEIYEDYRGLLDRQDINLVTISTPDHWHTKIAIDAMRAGKHIYCQKPLTLTIEEGKQIRKVLDETGVVFQVGTQQRSTDGFAKAVALCRAGRLGKLQTITCSIGGAPAGGPFQKKSPPEHLNWERWLGQTPLVDYIPERCHGNFRWWYEYSGGKMTDWGAHHVDIAHWAADLADTGPISVEGLSATHPVPFEHGYPIVDDSYNTATAFAVRCVFANGVEFIIRDDGRNGVLIEGDQGRIFVSRGPLEGKPVEDLRDNPLPEDAVDKLFAGPQRHGDHYRNFIECVKSGTTPVSDVPSHHRAITTCHLANIAIRLGRKIEWDPAAERIVGDDEAAAFERREQRAGYAIDVQV
jgi:predicted dehydrogenase